MIKVKIFLTHDNVFKLKVYSNDTAVNLIDTGVSRIVVNFADTQIDSAVSSSAFDFTTEGTSGIILFDFADLDLDVGRHLCSLTIYDTLHQNGQVWDNAFQLTINPQYVT